MYQDILPEEFNPWRRKGALVIDVREPWEYKRLAHTSTTGSVSSYRRGTHGWVQRGLPLEDEE